MTDIPTPKSDIPEENLNNPTPYKQVFKKNPLDGLPDWAKHPKNFETIEKALLDTLTCGKLHSDPIKMSECTKCTENMLVRKALMKKFGFSGVKQYMAWRKTHHEIKARMPLEMYNKMVTHE